MLCAHSFLHTFYLFIFVFIWAYVNTKNVNYDIGFDEGDFV